jgi:hypothetical protein
MVEATAAPKSAPPTLQEVQKNLADTVRAFNTEATNAQGEINYMRNNLAKTPRGEADFTGLMGYGGSTDWVDYNAAYQRSDRLETIARGIDNTDRVFDMLHIDTKQGVIDNADLAQTVDQLEAFGEYETSYAYSSGFSGQSEPSPVVYLASAAEYIQDAQNALTSGNLEDAMQSIKTAESMIESASHTTNDNYSTQ